MNEQAFEAIAIAQWERVPGHFKRSVENVALLIEDEPSASVRASEGLHEHETLLGLYHGVPNTERGEGYGVGGTLPDTITFYRLPILEEAHMLREEAGAAAGPFEQYVTQAVQETLWHELGHYFGLDEPAVRSREHGRSNHFH